MSKKKTRSAFVQNVPNVSKIALGFFAAFFIVGGFYYLSGLFASVGAATISIEPASATLVPGQNFDVDIYVDSDTSEMDTVQARVDFDPSKFNLLSINTEGSSYGVEAPSEQGADYVTVARGNTSPLTGRHKLVGLTFNVVADGGSGALLLNEADTVVLKGGQQLTPTFQNAEYIFAGHADVSLNPSTAQASIGENFQVAIEINSGDFLMDAADVRLTFDPSQFSYVSHSGTQSAFNIEAPSETGPGFVQIARGSDTTLTGNNQFAIVTMSVQGEGGTSDIGFDPDNTDVVYAGGALTTTLHSGSYTLADLTPPSIPGNLTAEALSKTQIDLTWSASADNVGVIGYNVYRNGERVGEKVVNTRMSDTGLSLNTSYTYYVEAVDSAGNVSDPSTEATAVTHRKLGDLNGDNVVNIFDLSILLENWGKTGDSGSDLNDDGVVDIYDLSTLLGAWEG